MRLINIHTVQFQEFADDERPPYAIASHRWGEEETSYKSFSNEWGAASFGRNKVQNFAKLIEQLNIAEDSNRALSDLGLRLRCSWPWIDTACINREDSAELSESINSMFRWYGSAAVFYAYLGDVLSVDYILWMSESQWFKRGWTLQELLAPRTVVFVARGWTVIGHKCSHITKVCAATCEGFGQRLNDVISRFTGISLNYLQVGNFDLLRAVPAKDILTWAIGRVTTREEDTVYCLLGLFDVYMPPIYGEGPHTFKRLNAATGGNLPVACLKELWLKSVQRPTYKPQPKVMMQPKVIQPTIPARQPELQLQDKALGKLDGPKLYSSCNFPTTTAFHGYELRKTTTAYFERSSSIQVSYTTTKDLPQSETQRLESRPLDNPLQPVTNSVHDNSALVQTVEIKATSVETTSSLESPARVPQSPGTFSIARKPLPKSKHAQTIIGQSTVVDETRKSRRACLQHRDGSAWSWHHLTVGPGVPQIIADHDWHELSGYSDSRHAQVKECMSRPAQGSPLRAMFDYESAHAETLSFKKGNIIVVTRTQHDHWWEGLLLKEDGLQDSRTGVFPSSYCESLVDDVLEEPETKPPRHKSHLTALRNGEALQASGHYDPAPWLSEDRQGSGNALPMDLRVLDGLDSGQTTLHVQSWHHGSTPNSRTMPSDTTVASASLHSGLGHHEVDDIVNLTRSPQAETDILADVACSMKQDAMASRSTFHALLSKLEHPVDV
ncbi:putative SH3 domain, heterokaryon incompatibility, SH3-like domain superfamily [Septoria linicola]|nr:putative SH3 domain, heterokaryon incompatibility, SH3-like domain superfamily [Septoria linicola]